MVNELCSRLLANPVIEDTTVSITATVACRRPGTPPGGPGGIVAWWRRERAWWCSRGPTASTTWSRPSRRWAPRPSSSGTAHVAGGLDAVVLPGGFAHGDYLRPGAIARFSPVMERGSRVRRRRRAGGGDLQRFPGAHRGRTCCPGALQKNKGLTFLCQMTELEVTSDRSVLTAGVEVGRRLRVPINHFEGNYTAAPDALAALEAEGRVVLRYVANPNGSAHDMAGVCNEARQRGRAHAPPRAGQQRAPRVDRRPGAARRLLGVGRERAGRPASRRYGQPAARTPTPTLHRALGLTDEEAARSSRLLGRPANHLELAMYAVMWSEHCSYKSSRLHLRRLPTEGPAVLVGPGENAGVIDAGDGIAVAIRIESHNHPSAIEPYQGAATGVGGIIRDIFTMGARPVALMDPLRFGPPGDPRNRWVASGVVSGISGYGNAVGVPTVGGELEFASVTRATRSSTSCAAGSCPKTAWFSAGPEVRATWPCCLARPRGATGSAG